MKRDTYHLDYETSSKVDIRKLGGHRYAVDPSTTILMFAIKKNDEEPEIWDFLDGGDEARDLLIEAVETESLIYAHNAAFEQAVSKYQLLEQVGVEAPKIENWRCTAAMCRRAAIPPALGQACSFLRFEDGKDKKGLALIHLFSDLNRSFTLKAPKGSKATNRKSFSPIHEENIPWNWMARVGGEDLTIAEAWEQFKDYCLQDVRAEELLHRKLHHFELEGDILESFQFNMRMNELGSPINVEALKHVQGLIEEYQARVGGMFEDLTDLRPTQTVKLLMWFQDHGYHGENLQADTVERVRAKNDMDEQGKRALELLQLLKFAALTKVPTMIAAECPDGTIKGSTLWHGARTGRATGRIHQPQNFKKATMETSLAYEMICEGAPLEDFEMMWDAPLELFASCIRHFIQHPTLNFLDGDYTGVEARITPWLAGDTRKLKSILDGVDQYKATGSMIFDKPIEEITKDERTKAKPVELGCCFGVGGRGLRNSLRDLHGVVLTLKECNRIVKVYRDNHPKTVEAWDELEAAARKAINAGTPSTILDGKIRVCLETHARIKFLVIYLPSGRGLYYPGPRIVTVTKKYTKEEMLEEPWKAEKKEHTSQEVQFYGTEPQSSRWGFVGTFGSRLFENCVQSLGADLLEAGCVEAEKRGYSIFAVIHDQALALAEPGKDFAGFADALCYKKPWAETFPLEADGGVAPYYRKD